jgi:hypothetical protein
MSAAQVVFWVVVYWVVSVVIAEIAEGMGEDPWPHRKILWAAPLMVGAEIASYLLLIAAVAAALYGLVKLYVALG